MEIRTNAPVEEIVVNDEGEVRGVRLECGEFIDSNLVVSNATPHITFNKLLTPASKAQHINPDLLKTISNFDYSSATTKINVAVSRLPNFSNDDTNIVRPHHEGTIHLGCETMDQLHSAFIDTHVDNKISNLPLIEMTIPSSLDKTITPPDQNQHVVNLFCQYTPFNPNETEEDKQNIKNKMFAVVDKYAPNFSSSVIGKPDILTPLELEKQFSLTGGNIMHGAMGLERLFFSRPTAELADYKVSDIRGLYICGAGCHPGGGVMGAAGRNAARKILTDCG